MAPSSCVCVVAMLCDLLCCMRRAVFKRGVGVSVLAEYLKTANKQVEVWLQVSRTQEPSC